MHRQCSLNRRCLEYIYVRSRRWWDYIYLCFEHLGTLTSIFKVVLRLHLLILWIKMNSVKILVFVQFWELQTVPLKQAQQINLRTFQSYTSRISRVWTCKVEHQNQILDQHIIEYTKFYLHGEVSDRLVKMFACLLTVRNIYKNIPKGVYQILSHPN